MISPQLTTLFSVCGSSVLAFWLAGVHRRFGPQTLQASLFACLAAFVLLNLVEHAAAPIADATGTAVMLLGVIVPAFGFAFWSGAVLLRAFATQRANR